MTLQILKHLFIVPVFPALCQRRVATPLWTTSQSVHWMLHIPSSKGPVTELFFKYTDGNSLYSVPPTYFVLHQSSIRFVSKIFVSNHIQSCHASRMSWKSNFCDM